MAQASWEEGTGSPTPPALPPGGRRVAVKVYDKLVKEFADLTIVQVRLRAQAVRRAGYQELSYTVMCRSH